MMKHRLSKSQKESDAKSAKPELVRRSLNRKSTIISGRTIGEARERLETANERAEARKKDKIKSYIRIAITTVGFIVLGALLVALYFSFTGNTSEGPAPDKEPETSKFKPTVEIIDEEKASGQISTRMYDYIGQAERDLKDLGYHPIKVILPSNSIREVDFYLEGYNGRIKMTIDRDSAVSAEDTDRMIRYLSGQGITDFEYIDVRIDGKAFWK